MTDEILRTSWATAREANHDGRVARTFYSILELTSDLGRLFPDRMDLQEERVFSAIGDTVDLLKEPERLTRYLERLGVRHIRYGVAPEHYPVVRDAYLDTLEYFLGDSDDWPAIRSAWEEHLNSAAKIMIGAALRAADNPTTTVTLVSNVTPRRAGAWAEVELVATEPWDVKPGDVVPLNLGNRPGMWTQGMVDQAENGNFTVAVSLTDWPAKALARAKPHSPVTMGRPTLEET
jgi:hemoglobin-like flavoprotein